MNEAVKLVADALADATNGVTALLADVPRVSGHAAPDALAAIYNRNDHPWVARGQVPRDDTTAQFPCLAVTLAEAATMDPSIKTASTETRLVTGTVTVAVQYLTRDPASAEAAVAAGYVLRAVRGALLRFEANRAATRTLNGVRLVQLQFPVRTFHGPLSVNDTVVSGLVLATWSVHETVSV